MKSVSPRQVLLRMVLLSLLGSSSAHIEQTSCYYATRGFVYSEYTDTCKVLWDKHMVRLEDMR
jgi:hypothetical protein